MNYNQYFSKKNKSNAVIKFTKESDSTHFHFTFIALTSSQLNGSLLHLNRLVEQAL